MNKVVLFILCFFTSAPIYATHFSGAHMRYEYMGTGNKYKIHLTLYKACESGAIDLPTFIGIMVKSDKQSLYLSRNLGRTSNDTLEPYCPGTTTSCTNLAAPYPGYIVATYTDTITLPVVSDDWNFVFSNSNRNFGIDNLQGASGQAFYIDAPLNLAAYHNTSAVIPDYPPHVLFANDSVKIPLTYSDPDGDSISFELVQPVSGAGVPIPYYSGYSVSQPFGANGLCYIDNENNLVLKATQTGKYTLAVKVKEYRNKTFITYTLRDFVIICIPNTLGGGITPPAPAGTGNLLTYTCPGRTNTLNFSFSDPVSTDMVYLDIAPPTIPGFSFSTSVSNGTGTATGSISWKTPDTLNPANIPFIDIQVTARDNACRMIGRSTYVYKVKTRDCAADSVWPGDANSDKIVDLYDPLAIALNYGDTGASRPSASNTWAAQYCDFWQGSFLNNIDKKHSDCNGNGVVDTADLAVIASNYNQSRPKGSSRSKGTAGEDLYFDHSGITPNPDSTVTIKIILGNASNSLTDVYGLAANITVNGLALANAPVISTAAGSWLGDTSNTLYFSKSISQTSVDWAYARTDHQHVTGQGHIADITFKIPATAQDGQMVTLQFDKTRIIDKNGLDKVDVSTLTDTFYIKNPISVNDVYTSLQNISLYPNPAQGSATLSLHSNITGSMHLRVTDVSGKVLATKQVPVRIGFNTIPLETNKLAPGLYIIHLQAAGAKTHVLKLVKN